jgi:hypothetical protein
VTFKSPSLGEAVADPKLLTQLLQMTLDSLENELRKADPVGAVRLWAGQYGLPEGWLECNGSSYNRTRYPELFNTIGTIFGSTATTFQVPNLVAPANTLYMIRAE